MKIVSSLFCLFLIFFGMNCQDSKVIESKTELKLPQIKKPQKTLNVGFLIMDGVYNTELTAPIDIFQHSIFHTKPGMKVFTIAKNKQAVLTFEGQKIIPDFAYLEDSIPLIDVLVVPSAEHHLDSDLEDSVMINFVKEVSEKAMFVTSHCDGAFVLAKAGILNGIESTTFPSDIDLMQKMFPDLTIHKDVVFVHDGKFITSVGGAKSFDAALYLVEILYGKKVANGIAKGLVIDWNLEKVPCKIIL